MDNSLQSKQAYLRENVLEMGYDADEFMAFLQLRKGEEGLDLNNWNIDELISVVTDFINAKNNLKNKNQEQEEYNKEESSPYTNIENDNKNLINNDITNNIENSINNNEQNNINEDVNNRDIKESIEQ